MDCIILAGGLGTRLRSVVSEVPKCMAPVAGKPFLYYILKYLTGYNTIDKVIISVGYLRETIFDWIENNKEQYPFEFDFAVEEVPLGTGGGIKLAMKKVKTDSVLVLNGDTFFDVNIDAFLEQHKDCGGQLSVALKPLQHFDRYGNVILEGSRVTAFREKELCAEGLINGGVYILSKNASLFENLPDKFSFETEVLQPATLQNRISGFIYESYFIDIGIPEDYAKANEEFKTLFL